MGCWSAVAGKPSHFPNIWPAPIYKRVEKGTVARVKCLLAQEHNTTIPIVSQRWEFAHFREKRSSLVIKFTLSVACNAGVFLERERWINPFGWGSARGLERIKSGPVPKREDNQPRSNRWTKFIIQHSPMKNACTAGYSFKGKRAIRSEHQMRECPRKQALNANSPCLYFE